MVENCAITHPAWGGSRKNLISQSMPTKLINIPVRVISFDLLAAAGNLPSEHYNPLPLGH